MAFLRSLMGPFVSQLSELSELLYGTGSHNKDKKRSGVTKSILEKLDGATCITVIRVITVIILNKVP